MWRMSPRSRSGPGSWRCRRGPSSAAGGRSPGACSSRGRPGTSPCTRATECAISFSQKTCLPAFIASMATGACSQSGRAMTTISTSGSASISLWSAYFLSFLTSAGGVLLVVGELLDGPLLLRRPDVAEADEVEVVAVVVADHRLATLVAGADDRGADRGLVHLLVAEVEGAQGRGGGGGLEQVAAGHAERPVRVLAAQGTLLGGQVGHVLAPSRMEAWDGNRDRFVDLGPIGPVSVGLVTASRRRIPPASRRSWRSPAAAAAAGRRARASRPIQWPGRDGDQGQAGEHLDQVLVDDEVMPLGLGFGGRPGQGGMLR